MTLRFETDDMAQLREAIMARGQTLATLLSEVLAGKHPPALAALLAEKPGLRPEGVEVHELCDSSGSVAGRR